jgi:hypothetical protein
MDDFHQPKLRFAVVTVGTELLFLGFSSLLAYGLAFQFQGSRFPEVLKLLWVPVIIPAQILYDTPFLYHTPLRFLIGGAECPLLNSIGVFVFYLLPGGILLTSGTVWVRKEVTKNKQPTR